MMNNTIKNIIMFVSGAAIGVVASWKFFEKKYSDIADAEIESVKETLYKMSENKKEDLQEDEEISDEVSEPEKNVIDYARSKPSISEYTKKVNDLGYVDYSTIKKEEKEETKMINRPYVIAPDTFGDDYETESLTYYKDGVVENDFGDVLDHTDKILGTDFVNHFGEYEQDTVFVRNDELKRDYEVLLDNRSYSELVNK